MKKKVAEQPKKTSPRKATRGKAPVVKPAAGVKATKARAADTLVAPVVVATEAARARGDEERLAATLALHPCDDTGDVRRMLLSLARLADLDADDPEAKAARERIMIDGGLLPSRVPTAERLRWYDAIVTAAAEAALEGDDALSTKMYVLLDPPDAPSHFVTRKAVRIVSKALADWRNALPELDDKTKRTMVNGFLLALAMGADKRFMPGARVGIHGTTHDDPSAFDRIVDDAVTTIFERSKGNTARTVLAKLAVLTGGFGEKRKPHESKREAEDRVSQKYKSAINSG